MKIKRPSYLSPSETLKSKEYEELKAQRQNIARQKLLNEIESNKRKVNTIKKNVNYSQSRSGKISNALTRGFKTIGTRGGTTNSLYSNSNTQRGYSKAGRPKGSVDPRYAQYGGVYGWRKYQATQLRIQRENAIRRATITPSQQAVLNNIERQRQIHSSSKESQIFPDTDGNVDMKGIFKEIDYFSNIAG